MTMALTPEILESCYAFLATTPPFKGWRMPPPDEVEFIVSRDPTVRGKYEQYIRGRNIGTCCISISEVNNGHTFNVIRTMAHEMTHLHLDRIGKADAGEHGANFKRAAARVCKFHGFDPKDF